MSIDRNTSLVTALLYGIDDDASEISKEILLSIANSSKYSANYKRLMLPIARQVLSMTEIEDIVSAYHFELKLYNFVSRHIDNMPLDRYNSKEPVDDFSTYMINLSYMFNIEYKDKTLN